MRRPIAIAGVAGLLALGGTAIAAPGGGPLGGILGGDRDERRAELAQDLGEKLNVSPDRVERALDEVESERRAEHRKQKAEDLAANLDGVSAADVEKALEKLEKEREDGQLGGPPGRGAHLEALAKELGKTTAEVRAALEKAHRARAKAEVEEALKDGRITKEHADEIKKRIESGELRGPHGGPGGHGGPGHGRGGPGGFRGGPPPFVPEDGAAGAPPAGVDPS